MIHGGSKADAALIDPPTVRAGLRTALRGRLLARMLACSAGAVLIGAEVSAHDVGHFARALEASVDTGRMTIFKAAEAGDLDHLRAYLDAGGAVDRRAPQGATALYHAVRGGQAGAVELLLEAGAEVDIPHPITRLTPAGLAAQALQSPEGSRGDGEVVNLMLTRAAQAQEDLDRRVTSLMEVWDSQTALGLLADPLPNRLLARLLKAACAAGDAAVLERMIAQSDALPPTLHGALAAGQCALEPAEGVRMRTLFERRHNAHLVTHIKTLLAEGYLYTTGEAPNPQVSASIDHRNSEGETLLMFASATGNAALVRLLLSHGADPGATNGQGQTAADLAGTRWDPDGAADEIRLVLRR